MLVGGVWVEEKPLIPKLQTSHDRSEEFHE